jgi:hypothetical protein
MNADADPKSEQRLRSRKECDGKYSLSAKPKAHTQDYIESGPNNGDDPCPFS